MSSTVGNEFKFKLILPAVAASCLLMQATFVGATTQVETLTPGEITPEQLEALAAQQPFRWTRATRFRFLETASTAQDGALRRGDLASYLTAAQQQAGFAWDPVQGRIVLRDASGADSSVLAADLSENLMAGWRQNEVGRRAFIWNEAGLQDLNALAQPPEGTVLTEAQGLGASGIVAGRLQRNGDETGVFVWQPGAQVQLLPEIEDGRPESARAVSARGHVIGQAEVAGVSQGYVWQDGAQGRLLPVSLGRATDALGVNGAGDVVGSGELDGPRAMIWPADGSAGLDLNEALAEPLQNVVRLIRAEAINDAGEIAAYGVTEAGNVHLVLLAPQRGGAIRSYQPQDLGEVYIDVAAQPLAMLEITETSDIYGSCVPLAQVCPAIGARRARELAEALEVTNLFDPGAGGQGALLGLPALAAAGFTPGDGAGATGGQGVSSSGRQGGPVQGTPFFPPLTTTPGSGGEAGSVPPTAPVPLPAAIWAMLMGLVVVMRPWRWRRLRAT